MSVVGKIIRHFQKLGNRGYVKQSSRGVTPARVGTTITPSGRNTQLVRTKRTRRVSNESQPQRDAAANNLADLSYDWTGITTNDMTQVLLIDQPLAYWPDSIPISSPYADTLTMTPPLSNADWMAVITVQARAINTAPANFLVYSGLNTGVAANAALYVAEDALTFYGETWAPNFLVVDQIGDQAGWQTFSTQHRKVLAGTTPILSATWVSAATASIRTGTTSVGAPVTVSKATAPVNIQVRLIVNYVPLISNQ